MVAFQQIIAAQSAWYQPGEHGDGELRSTLYGLDTEGRVWRLDSDSEWFQIPAPEDPEFSDDLSVGDVAASGR